MIFTLMTAAIASALGVYTAYLFESWTPLFIAVAAMSALVIKSIASRKLEIYSILCIALFCACFLSYNYAVSPSVNPTMNYDKKYVEMDGVILTPPSPSSTSDCFQYNVYVKTLDYTGNTVTVNDTVRLSSRTSLRCGDSVRIKGILKNISPAANENGFNARLYYRSMGIYMSTYSEEIEPADKIKIISPYLIAGKIQQFIDDTINKYYYGDTAAVLSMILTGNTSHFSDDYRRIINNNSLKRLYHPAYIFIWVFMLFSVFTFNLIHAKIRNYIIAAIFILFSLVSCSSIGFSRCMLSFAMLAFFRASHLDFDAPDALAIIIIFAMLFAPLMLFNSGFVLSVTAGLLIYRFNPIVKRFFGLGNGIFDTLISVTIISIVFYLPFAAIWFNGISPYTYLANFITVLPVFVILLLSPILFICLNIFGSAPIIKAYFDFCLWVLLKLPKAIDALPNPKLCIPSPPPTALAVFICIIMSIYYLCNREKNRAVYTVSAALGLSVVLSAVMIGDIGTVKLQFVNVDQGDGAVIHKTFGETILIDGGGGNSYSKYNPGETLYVPYLMSKGYRNIDAAFVSHLHKDHVEGIIAAMENLRVKNVFLLKPQGDLSEEMLTHLNNLNLAASENNTKINYIDKNSRFVFDGGIILDVFVPNETTVLSTEENDTSLLIRAAYGETSCLYTGDLSSFGEYSYLKHISSLDSDILKVSHHGSAHSSRTEFVDAVSPQYSVISCGENNSYGFPSEYTLDRLKDSHILRTDLNGSIEFTADKNDIRRIEVTRQ